ncbi:MAG: YgiQ family radical SAM protein [Defluviitaleaceae bacterium]|nr:YgiQ family radical SAM protein [Defluviitaleaceae bacterium]MCL2263654.1 YgiQ family radical SAM protein [Defluviitaleaceae bacterium]MCL2263887.1 YgiQ family radical SAM protein [Defluviitaleaceae bacterium]
MPFLPVSSQEIGSPPDFVLVTGDAYVDHPSFGAAIIARVLESHGFSVAVLAQPCWKSTADFTRFGEPKLGFLVTGGNIDSMVNHYTVALHKRKTDAYTAGGEVGKRPNRASIVYSNKIREVYKEVPIILGGLEASLRRLAHYDYWDNAVRRSILLDAAADLIVYGMGEKQIVEIAEALQSGIAVKDITFIDGTVFKTKDISFLPEPLILPTFKTIKEPTTAAKKEYARSFMLQYNNTDYLTANVLVEDYANHYVVQNRPAKPLTAAELDRVYSLPYTREVHPMHENVPAIEEVKFSITAQRGCFGGCNFCSLSFHQGRIVQARSHKSIITEARNFTHDPLFKGYIHDVGGPTANFRAPSCDRHKNENAPPCKRQCLFPKPCPHLKFDHADYLKLLRTLREIPGIKKVFIRSGIRYDYLMHDPKGDIFLKELCEHHISGRLKVAPEHVSAKVLYSMGKPDFCEYKKFAEKFAAINKKLNKDQYLVPYLMSSHPACTLNDAIELAEHLQSTNVKPEQVQDFYPTPGTLSTCMYYTGIDPRTQKRVFVPKSQHEKTTQRALIQYRLPANKKIVTSALIRAGRKDLIGHHPRALIRPTKKPKR